MSRAILYARVSTTEQADSGYSLEFQSTKAKMYADLKDWAVVDTIQDAGVSGAKALGERPGGSRLLRLAEAGLFDVVIMTKLDRFSRSVGNAIGDFDVLDKLGIEVVFVEDNIDTTTPQGRVVRNMLLTFAEFERETIRDRNMAGRFAKASEGNGWVVGRVPVGYRLVDGMLQEHEAEADIVRRVFKMRASGATYEAIAEALNEAGHKPRAAKNGSGRFTASSVSKYIKKTYYKGEPITKELSPSLGQEAQTFEFPAPALVSTELWDRANSVQLGSKQAATGRTYGLSGRIHHDHGHETSTMFGQARRTAQGWTRLYRCGGSRTEEGCTGFGEVSKTQATSFRAEFAEALFLRWAVSNGYEGIDVEAVDATLEDGAALPNRLVERALEIAEDRDLHVTTYRSVDPRRPNLKIAREAVAGNGVENARLLASGTAGVAVAPLQ